MSKGTLPSRGSPDSTLTGSALDTMLIAHLRSADFFDTEHHPTTQFTATAAEKIATCTDGTPNHLLRSHPLSAFRVPLSTFASATTARANSSASSANTSSTTTSIIHVKIHAERQE